MSGEQRSTILVIDDEIGPRESIRFLFNTDHDVHCADSVDRGIELLREVGPDVIIMDIKMPEKTGIDGLREIRAIDPDISVIMLTGFGTLETAQEAIRLGANDYIKKPFDTREMRETVMRYVEQTRVVRKRKATSTQLESINEQLKAQLTLNEHLASLGQASSEFVHDLRNPLSVICGYVQLLLDDLKRNEQWRTASSTETTEYLEIIAKNAQRCQEMSAMWKELAQSGPPETEPCRISELVAEVTESTAHLARQADAVLTIDDTAGNCVIAVNRLQMFRAIQNVVSNAVQALRHPGGHVRIGWGARDNRALITVEDDGCGIPSESLAAVFNAGYTSKQKSGGMGIGLFITRKIVENHGGTIVLENRPEGGARATISLPVPFPATVA